MLLPGHLARLTLAPALLTKSSTASAGPLAVSLLDCPGSLVLGPWWMKHTLGGRSGPLCRLDATAAPLHCSSQPLAKGSAHHHESSSWRFCEEDGISATLTDVDTGAQRGSMTCPGLHRE